MVTVNVALPCSPYEMDLLLGMYFTLQQQHGGVCRSQEDVYTMMNSVGTLMSHLGGGAAAVGSPEQTRETATLYTNIGHEDGACALSGRSQVPKKTDPEGRYVIVN